MKYFPFLMVVLLAALFPSAILSETLDTEDGWTHAWDAGFNCVGLGATLDNRGYVYFTGYSGEDIPGAEYLEDFPVESDFEGDFYGGSYLSKYTEDGEHVWTKMWHGMISAVDSDEEGNVYVGGTYETPVASDESGAFMPTDEPDGFIYLAKISTEGEVVWVRSWECIYPENIQEISVDAEGRIYMTGLAIGTRWWGDGPWEAMQSKSWGGYDIYLVRFDTDGNAEWVRSWGGEDFDTVDDMDISPEGIIYVTGSGYGHVELGSGLGEIEMGEDGAIYIMRFDPNGDPVGYKTFEGAAGLMSTVAADDSGFVCLTIEFMEYLELQGQPGDWYHGSIESPRDGYSTLIIRLDEFCDFQWGAFIFSDGSCTVTNARRDGAGNLYVAGNFKGETDFNSGDDVHSEESRGNEPNCFMAVLDRDGNFGSVDTWGVEGWSYVWGMDVSEDGDVYLTGDDHYDIANENETITSDQIYLRKIPNDTIGNKEIGEEEMSANADGMEAPKINIRFLFVMCNDIDAMRTFYTDLMGMQEQAYMNDEQFGYLCYNSEGFQLMFFRTDEQMPVPDKWAWQPGYGGGTLNAPSWAVQIPETGFKATIARIRDGSAKVFSEFPEWRQGSYWGFNVMDPMGNTIEVFMIPAEKPRCTDWME